MSTAIAAAGTITDDFFEAMRTRILSFRCPAGLLEQANSAASQFQRTRNSVLLAAVRLFARQLQEQHGGNAQLPLPADMLTHESLFPKPESKGGRPPKVRPEPQA